MPHVPDDHGQEERRSRNRPETLRLRAICPVLAVTDLQTSLSWYCDIAGFTLAETRERDGVIAGVTLVAGSERVILRQAGLEYEGAERTDGVRLELRTSQDVDALAAGVLARGGSLVSGPERASSGERCFTLVDPDGLVLTIVSER